jgi:DNA modification methylase
VVTTPYYQDDQVTLYHGDCLTETVWLASDVLVTDPPYGSEAGGYGRRNKRIANDAGVEVRDAALAAWGEKPALCMASPRLSEPPGGWDHRLVWDKREAGLGNGPWRYSHEMIFVRGPGWVRVNAKSFSILSVPSGNGSPDKLAHVHSKPVSLMCALISAAPAGIIADPFAGSGATLVAAKSLGRNAIGVELEERYCELIATRLAQDAFDFGEAS